MLELERLLKFTPDEAILMMANKEMNTYLRPEIATVGPVASTTSPRTSVDIISLVTDLDMIQNPYRGRSTLEYSRYDLTGVFDTIFSDIKPPTTTYALLESISKATGIVFTPDDFNNDVIEQDAYWLQAKPGSKRWHGAVKVIFDSGQMTIDISQYLINNYHDGLVTKIRKELWEAFPNDILDGLTLGKPGIGVYLRNNHHDGLTNPTRVNISTYLPIAHHDGLVYIRQLVFSENSAQPDSPSEDPFDLDLF